MSFQARQQVVMDDALKNVQPFDFESIPASELRSKWIDYKRNFAYIARTLPVESQMHLKSVFLARTGRPLQRIVEDLAAQDGPDEELLADDGSDAYEEMVTKLDNYFAPKQHDVMQRHEFWSMECKENETLDKFIIRARVAANKCEVGKSAKEFREILVMDKILMIAPPDLKNKILDAGQMDLDKMTRLVTSHLTTKRQASKLNESIMSN